jgi:leucyl aminopeptidase
MPLIRSGAVNVEASTDSPLATTADTIVIGVFEDEGVAHDLPGGRLEALLDSGEGGRAFKRLALTHHEDRRVILIGLGARAELDAERAREAAGIAHKRARQCRATKLCWEIPHHVGDEIVEGIVSGTVLAGYRFTRYKPAPADEHPLERLIVSAHHDISAPTRRASVLATAQNRARDLANAPPNELTPTALADYATELAGRDDALRITVFDGDQIRERGMGAFAAIAQGSDQDPRMIELVYEPEGVKTPRLALIGKAVTFDSGGLAIKPANSMTDMKFDMCGGAAVIEAIAALAGLQAPVRVLGVVGATENMINGSAVRPGDIVTALDGTTIEVANPDAEGRMVLADCMTHARREGCDAIVDIATLTGAVIAALAGVYAGVFSNDDALTERLTECGRRAGEPLWRLPLHPEFAEMTKSRYAQLTNRPEPRQGLASSSAEFLHHFAGDVPWAHIDMAGVGSDRKRAYLDRLGSGWGVRLLAELALDFAR